MYDIEELYNDYAKSIYKYIYSLCRNESLSEDIVQETFLVASENINKFKGESKLSSWLCSIAKYILYGKMKKDRKISKFSIEEVENIIPEYNLIDEDIFKNEEKMFLYKQIQNLDEETRNIMYLRILGNLSYEEISEITGKSINVIRVKFFRGKEKIIKEKNKYE